MASFVRPSVCVCVCVSVRIYVCVCVCVCIIHGIFCASVDVLIYVSQHVLISILIAVKLIIIIMTIITTNYLCSIFYAFKMLLAVGKIK